jgi:hypothetical protein
VLRTAVVLACGATLPAALGVCLGHESIGFIASFGAYLVTITHADLPIKGRAQRLLATILMLCVGAIAGASAGQRVWIFLPLAAVAASWQAWTEIADTGLRFPAAMAVLALFCRAGTSRQTSLWRRVVSRLPAEPSGRDWLSMSRLARATSPQSVSQVISRR